MTEIILGASERIDDKRTMLKGIPAPLLCFTVLRASWVAIEEAGRSA
jgi:hypothetical protein